MVKYKGIIISNVKFFRVEYFQGWNNSMACYYPNYSLVSWDDENKQLFRTHLGLVEGWSEPMEPKGYEFTIDNKMLHDYEYYKRITDEETEKQTVRMHKRVLVYKGRKLPVGTVGEVFWLGNSGYGMSVGIRLLDGSKVFTALTNVKVYTKEQEYKDQLNELIKIS